MNSGIGVIKASYSPIESNWEVWNATITGFSSFSTNRCNYKVIGNLVILSFLIQGTSNSSGFTISLPKNLPVKVVGTPIIGLHTAITDSYVLDNGSVTPTSRVNISQTTNIITIYASDASGGFTASGTKAFRATMTYNTW